MLWTAPFLIGCGTPELIPEQDDCALEPPAQGEVRAKRITCTEELPERAEGRVGDWLLESADLKLIIRNTPNRMTQLGGAGGTIIDASVAGRPDALTELVPVVEGGWPESISINAEGGSIVLRARDGTERVLRYQLDPLSGTLIVEGSQALTWVPVAGSTVTGQWLNASGLAVTSDIALEDRGGWVHWPETDSLILGTPGIVSASTGGDNAVVASGTSDGTWIEVGGPDTILFRAQPANGFFSLSIPQGRQVRTTKQGHAPSPWILPTQDMSMTVGDEGFLTLTVSDEDGIPVPANLTWNGEVYAVPNSDLPLPVGPGLGSGTVDAGPEYGRANISEMSISGTVSHAVELSRILPAAAWAAFSEPGFPDERERRPVADVMLSLAGQGIDYAVLNATDEVSQTSGADEFADLISVSSASRSGGPFGGVLAWPWSGDTKQAAHGAVDWRNQDAADLLALMSKSGRRNTAVTADWIAAAGPPRTWETIPYTMKLSTPAEIDVLASVWDHWIPIAPISDHAWVHVDGRSKTEILRGILEGRTTATTGPQVYLTVDGEPPGTAFVEQAERTVTVAIDGPGDVSSITLIGASGAIQGPWDVGDLPIETTIAHGGWVAVVAEGVEDWAVTSPVWLSQP